MGPKFQLLSYDRSRITKQSKIIPPQTFFLQLLCPLLLHFLFLRSLQLLLWTSITTTSSQDGRGGWQDLEGSNGKGGSGSEGADDEVGGGWQDLKESNGKGGSGSEGGDDQGGRDGDGESGHVSGDREGWCWKNKRTKQLNEGYGSWKDLERK